MRLRVMGGVLVAALLVQEASAADLTRWGVPATARVTQITPAIPERAIARLADQGLGYSVLHEGLDVPQRGYRVHVTCTTTETFRQTYCPTPDYVATCPSASIACR